MWAIILGIMGFILGIVIWGSIIGSILIVVGAVAILEGGWNSPLAWVCLTVGLIIAFTLDSVGEPK